MLIKILFLWIIKGNKEKAINVFKFHVTEEESVGSFFHGLQFPLVNVLSKSLIRFVLFLS